MADAIFVSAKKNILLLQQQQLDSAPNVKNERALVIICGQQIEIRNSKVKSLTCHALE